MINEVATSMCTTGVGPSHVEMGVIEADAGHIWRPRCEQGRGKDGVVEMEAFSSLLAQHDLMCWNGQAHDVYDHE